MTDQTTPSIWQATSPHQTYPTTLTERDRSCDVLIVGAGITGLTAGVILAQAGKHVVVVDKAPLGHGTSGYTTAHLTVMNDLGYSDAISDFSQKDAQTLADASRSAIEQIATWCKTFDIDCDFERKADYYFTENHDDLKLLRDEYDALKKVGIEAEMLETTPLPFPVQGAVKVQDQARFNPMLYMQGLIEQLTTHGGSIYQNVTVQNIDDGEPCRVETDQGMIRAQQVIIATHMPLNDVYVFAKLEAYRSYVLGVRLHGDVPKGLFSDTNDPYYYINEYRDDQGDVLIVGGEDHKTGTEDEQAAFDALEQYVRQRFNVAEIAYRWSAQWYEASDGLPYIGAYPLRPHVSVGTGYGGNGMTFGTLAGMIISDAILERENPFADLFSLNRITVSTSLPSMVKAGLESGVHFIKDRFQRDAKNLEEVGIGEGKLMPIDGEQTAVYRDDDGTIHKLSPICTHLGCVVQWNTAERSWDCPCHGGRFSATGEVLVAPPTRNLERRDEA